MNTYIGKTISFPYFVDTDNIIEDSDKENKYRYFLFIPFSTNLLIKNKTLAVIMKNPSSASCLVCDMTILKVCNVAYNNGYNGVTIVNLFPLRATKATDLQYFYANTDYDKIMKNNINKVKSVIVGSDVVFAWGKDTIHGKKLYPFNYNSAIENMERAVKEVNCPVYFVDSCKCCSGICNADKRVQCNSKVCYPLHGLRWSSNSKLIKY